MNQFDWFNDNDEVVMQRTLGIFHVGLFRVLFLACSLLIGVGSAQAEGFWRLLRVDEFQAPVFNSPSAPGNLRNPYCPTQTIEVGPGRDTLHVTVKDVKPAECNNGYRIEQVYSHQWTQPPTVLPAGKVMPFSLGSKVVTVENVPNRVGSASARAGFIAYDDVNGPYGPGSNEPSTAKVATTHAYGPANTTDIYSNEKAQAKGMQPFIMPAHPWLSSDRNDGLVRFRVWTGHVAPWRAVDYVYKWDASGSGGLPAEKDLGRWPPMKGNAASLDGVWSINANGYPGKLEIAGSMGRLVGRVRFDAQQAWEDLKDISFDGRTLSFLRPSGNQHYIGTLSGDEVRGTFDGGGTWSWRMVRGDGGGQPVSSIVTPMVGTWSLNANGYAGKLELVEKNRGSLLGRIWFDAQKTWEDLQDISFDGHTLSFLRPGANQRYTGTLSGNEVRGTFDGGGTWSWRMVRGDGQPVSSIVTPMVGAWSLNANGYAGKLELVEKNRGSLLGRIWFDAQKTWEDLQDISFDGRTLSFIRPGAKQRYTGILSGNEVRGTFEGGGSWNWSMVRGKAVSEQNDLAWLGRTWRVRESTPDGAYCDGLWTRQGSSNRFSGEWACSWGARVTDSLVVQPLTDNQVTVLREGLRQNYRGTLSTDRRGIVGTTWAAGGRWQAQIQP